MSEIPMRHSVFFFRATRTIIGLTPVPVAMEVNLIFIIRTNLIDLTAKTIFNSTTTIYWWGDDAVDAAPFRRFRTPYTYIVHCTRSSHAQHKTVGNISFVSLRLGCAEMIILAFMPISLYYHDEHDKLLLMVRRRTSVDEASGGSNGTGKKRNGKKVKNEADWLLCPFRTKQLPEYWETIGGKTWSNGIKPSDTSRAYALRFWSMRNELEMANMKKSVWWMGSHWCSHTPTAQSSLFIFHFRIEKIKFPAQIYSLNESAVGAATQRRRNRSSSFHFFCCFRFQFGSRRLTDRRWKNPSVFCFFFPLTWSKFFFSSAETI